MDNITALRNRAAQIKNTKEISAQQVKSIRQVTKTDVYDTLCFDGVSDTISFFAVPMGTGHTMYRRDGTKPTYSKTQAETNIRKSNELEIGQQAEILGMSLAIDPSTLKLNTDADANNNIADSLVHQIFGEGLFRLKIGETEKLAVPLSLIPSGSAMYGTNLISRGVPNDRNFYSFGSKSITLNPGETFRPEINFQQNVSATDRAKLEGLKIMLRFYVNFARPVV